VKRYFMRILLLIFLISLSSYGGELTSKWSTEFTGSFDGEKQVRLLLYRDSDNSGFGSYYNTSELVRTNVKGIVSGNKIKFSEMNGDKEVAVFEGSISDAKKPTLTGTYTKAGQPKECTFTYHIHFPSRPGKSLYAPISADSTKEVEEFAAKFKKNVLEGNKAAVAAAIHYTIELTIDGESVSIKDKETFLKNYDKIFHAEFLESVKKNCFPMNMCNSYKGVWLGFNREFIIQMTRKDDGPFSLHVSEIHNKTKK
jgi:hypothetical protein